MMGMYDTLRHLAVLCRRIVDGEDVSDECLIRAVEGMELATNCESAAEALFAAVGVPCMLRPSLRPALLKMALDPLYCLGLSEADEILAWARATADRGDQYVPWGEHTRRFVREILCEERTTIQTILDALAMESATAEQVPFSP